MDDECEHGLSGNCTECNLEPLYEEWRKVTVPDLGLALRGRYRSQMTAHIELEFHQRAISFLREEIIRRATGEG